MSTPEEDQPEPCEEPGCVAAGFRCTLVDYSGAEPLEDVSIYCSEHARKNGFCMGCGTFCAGLESFDFGRHPGFCDTCQDEIDANDRNGQEEEDYAEGDYDEP